jgi:hypothetical protein
MLGEVRQLRQFGTALAIVAGCFGTVLVLSVYGAGLGLVAAGFGLLIGLALPPGNGRRMAVGTNMFALSVLALLILFYGVDDWVKTLAAIWLAISVAFAWRSLFGGLWTRPTLWRHS